MEAIPPDIGELLDQLAAIERDAAALVDGLSPEHGAWRPAPEAWSVAECLDHLAITNRAYLAAMRAAAGRARERRRWRRGTVRPGLFGRWFVAVTEPPPRGRLRMRAPRTIRPRGALPLADAHAAFQVEHHASVAFLREQGDLDLARILFRDPIVPVVPLSLATGLYLIAAHDRRHLWQAWRVRRAAEG